MVILDSEKRSQALHDDNDGDNSVFVARDVLEEEIKPGIKEALRQALRKARGRLDTKGGQFCLLGADLVRTMIPLLNCEPFNHWNFFH
mmetsp:Transcript_39210/g.103757  ORF Transcript_39210/g.103757 Transcript_39210/m.103757 type:complete len:88 (-) Transcript_39210:1102-1365(-)